MRVEGVSSGILIHSGEMEEGADPCVGPFDKIQMMSKCI